MWIGLNFEEGNLMMLDECLGSCTCLMFHMLSGKISIFHLDPIDEYFGSCTCWMFMDKLHNVQKNSYYYLFVKDI